MKRLKQRFLDYINKAHFDHTQEPVDPEDFYSVHMTFLKLFNVSDEDHKPYWHCIFPILVVFNGIFGAIVFTISLTQHTEFHLITESGSYVVIMIYKLLIVSCSYFNKKEYRYFLKAMREDFKYINTRGLKYRDKFFANQKLTFKASILSSIFIVIIGSGMMISGAIAWIYTANFNTKYGNRRPLTYPFRLFDWDLYATPMYEIMFLISIACTTTHVYAYSTMIQSEIIWVRQITCKADVMIWSIQDVLVDVKPARNKNEQKYYTLLINRRMREIIKMHHSMITLCEAYAAVYTKCLLFEQKLAASLICLTAYCVAEQFDDGNINVILILLCISVIVLVSIPNYLCTYLAEKVESVSDACWDMPFWNAGPVICPYALLIMQRSMRPLPIQNAGFEDISLQTYANIIVRAYSCFNMLRQSNFNL